MSEEKQLVNMQIADGDLEMVTGGKKKGIKKKRYICQACGEKFEADANKKWNGEPVCDKCKPKK